MAKYLGLLVEHGSGIAGALIAWAAGYIFLHDEEFVRLGLDVAGYFFGLAVGATWRFELLKEDTERGFGSLQGDSQRRFDRLAVDTVRIMEELRKLLDAITPTRFLSDYFRATLRGNPLINEILRNQLRNFQEIVEKAADGYITMSYAHHSTIIAYPQLFSHLPMNAQVRATLTLLPISSTRRMMIEENQRFIDDKHGTVERIFVFSAGSHIADWQQFANEQRAVKVLIRFLFREDLDAPTPVFDLFITGTPPMAIIAEVDSGANVYTKVTLHTDADRINDFELLWNTLRTQSVECTSNDTITKAVETRARITVPHYTAPH